MRAKERRLQRASPAPPAGLTAYRLTSGGEAIAFLSFPLAPVELPGSLTPAEQAVVRLALDGRSNAAVARARGVSTRTVANQLASAYAKLGVAGRAGLVQLLSGRGR